MSKNKAKKLPQVIMISDPNSDADDLVSFVMASTLADQRAIKIEGVIATAGDCAIRTRRAKFSKGVFKSLGCLDVKVAVGSDYEATEGGRDNFYGDCNSGKCLEQTGQDIQTNPASLLHTVFDNAETQSVDIVINAQMNDVTEFLQSCDNLTLQKLNRIIIMGGYLPSNENGRIVPHPESYNNKVCFPAAEKLFQIAQDKNMHLVFVPKEVVYQVQIDRQFYDDLEKLENPVAKTISASNKVFLGHLWDGVRAGDFSHFDIRRFAKVFLGEDYKISKRMITGHDGFQVVWPLIKYLNFYDALTILAVSDAHIKPFAHFRKVLEDKNIYVMEVDNASGLRKQMCDLVWNKLR